MREGVYVMVWRGLGIRHCDPEARWLVCASRMAVAVRRKAELRVACTGRLCGEAWDDGGELIELCGRRLRWA